MAAMRPRSTSRCPASNIWAARNRFSATSRSLRASPDSLPASAAVVAVLTHCGPFSDLDQAYGTLGTFVTERVLAADGPIREHYLVTADDTDDPAAYRTEICWPIRADAIPATRT